MNGAKVLTNADLAKRQQPAMFNGKGIEKENQRPDTKAVAFTKDEIEALLGTVLTKVTGKRTIQVVENDLTTALVKLTKIQEKF